MSIVVSTTTISEQTKGHPGLNPKGEEEGKDKVKVIVTILLLFTGYIAGPLTASSGGTNDHLCLPENPTWNKVVEGEGYSRMITGVNLENVMASLVSDANNEGKPLANSGSRCAVCYRFKRSMVQMIPAQTECPSRWTKEYGGYLASDYTGSRRVSYRTSAICLDEAPESADSAGKSYLYPVTAECGALPCDKFPIGHELACVVCSK